MGTPGAGHLLNTPYTPPNFNSLHALAPKGMRLYMGGADAPEEHHSAAVKSYADTVLFLKKALHV